MRPGAFSGEAAVRRGKCDQRKEPAHRTGAPPAATNDRVEHVLVTRVGRGDSR